MRKITFIVTFILASLLAIIFINVDHFSPQMIEAMSMLSCSEVLKSNPFETLDDKCRIAISEIRYSKGGQITLYNKKYDLSLTYIPTHRNDQNEWVCVGEPKKFFPLQCRH